MTTENIIGEIIESSTFGFTAESRHLYSPPLFGSFVKIQQNNGVESTPAEDNIAEIEDSIDNDPFSSHGGSFNRQYQKTFNAIINADEISAQLLAGIYGVVYNACTTPVNKGGRLRAFWKNEEQLKEEQPQLEEWHLLTEFKAVIIGYADDRGVFHQFIPPQPPKVHVSVQPCSEIEIRAITSKLHFLRTLMNFYGCSG